MLRAAHAGERYNARDPAHVWLPHDTPLAALAAEGLTKEGVERLHHFVRKYADPKALADYAEGLRRGGSQEREVARRVNWLAARKDLVAAAVVQARGLPEGSVVFSGRGRSTDGRLSRQVVELASWSRSYGAGRDLVALSGKAADLAIRLERVRAQTASEVRALVPGRRGLAEAQYGFDESRGAPRGHSPFQRTYGSEEARARAILKELEERVRSGRKLEGDFAHLQRLVEEGLFIEREIHRHARAGDLLTRGKDPGYVKVSLSLYDQFERWEVDFEETQKAFDQALRFEGNRLGHFTRRVKSMLGKSYRPGDRKGNHQRFLDLFGTGKVPFEGDLQAEFLINLPEIMADWRQTRELLKGIKAREARRRERAKANLSLVWVRKDGEWVPDMPELQRIPLHQKLRLWEAVTEGKSALSADQARALGEHLFTNPTAVLEMNRRYGGVGADYLKRHGKAPPGGGFSEADGPETSPHDERLVRVRGRARDTYGQGNPRAALPRWADGLSDYRREQLFAAHGRRLYFEHELDDAWERGFDQRYAAAIPPDLRPYWLSAIMPGWTPHTDAWFSGGHYNDPEGHWDSSDRRFELDMKAPDDVGTYLRGKARYRLAKMPGPWRKFQGVLGAINEARSPEAVRSLAVKVWKYFAEQNTPNGGRRIWSVAESPFLGTLIEALKNRANILGAAGLGELIPLQPDVFLERVVSESQVDTFVQARQFQEQQEARLRGTSASRRLWHPPMTAEQVALGETIYDDPKALRPSFPAFWGAAGTMEERLGRAPRIRTIPFNYGGKFDFGVDTKTGRRFMVRNDFGDE